MNSPKRDQVASNQSDVLRPGDHVKTTEEQYPQERYADLDELEIEKGLNSSKLKSLSVYADSLSTAGMDNPILVRHLPNSQRLSIIDGRHRYEAAKQAGLQQVPIKDYGPISKNDARLLAWRQNVLRRKSSKKEIMDTVRDLNKDGMGGSDIARLLGLAKSTVSEYLTLSRASPKLRKAAEKGTGEGGIPTKAALRAAKLPVVQQQRATPKLVGKTSRQAEHVLGPATPRTPTNPTGARVGVLMPGEKLPTGYRLVSDYKERCQKLEMEVLKRLRQTPSSQRLQGMELVIGVLRGKLTVDQAFVNWQKA